MNATPESVPAICSSVRLPLCDQKLNYLLEQLAPALKDLPNEQSEFAGRLPIFYTTPAHAPSEPCVIVVPCKEHNFCSTATTDLTIDRWILPDELSAVGWQDHFHDPIPVLFSSSSADNDRKSAPVERKSNGTIIFTVDLFASAFVLLTRLEEYYSNIHDEHGRFPLNQTLLVEQFLSHAPAPVDQYVTLLKLSMNIPVDQPLMRWPNGKEFALCLTHDIDFLYKWRGWRAVRQIKQDLGTILQRPHQRENYRMFGKNLWAMAKHDNPYWNLSEIAALEKSYDFCSTFFIMSGQRGALDGDYRLDEPAVQQLLAALQNAGFEIGLHGSYRSFDDPSIFATELEALRSLASTMWGNRQHYLRFDLQKNFHMYEENGIKYDTTLGFAEHEGYRSSYSLPYFPYNFADNRPFDVLEIPLTVMDTTLYQYQQLSAPLAWQALERQLQYVRRTGGCCTLLWHNTYFDQEKYPGYAQVYQQALQWVAENNGWGTSALRIWQWYTGQ